MKSVKTKSKRVAGRRSVVKYEFLWALGNVLKLRFGLPNLDLKTVIMYMTVKIDQKI